MPIAAWNNCANCGFNRANKIIDGYIRNVGTAQCAIRPIKINDPFQTYCANWYSLNQSFHENILRDKKPKGVVYAVGFYEEGPCIIPWHGNSEPRDCRSGRCYVCASEFIEGIEVVDENGEARQFCSCAHYIRWWQKFHADVKLPKDYNFGYYNKMK